MPYLSLKSNTIEIIPLILAPLSNFINFMKAMEKFDMLYGFEIETYDIILEQSIYYFDQGVFGVDIRFPKEGFYVDLADDSYIEILSQLRSFLVQANFELSRSQLDNVSSIIPQYFDKLKELKKSVYEAENIYNRESFEQKYEIKWC